MSEEDFAALKRARAKLAREHAFKGYHPDYKPPTPIRKPATDNLTSEQRWKEKIRRMYGVVKGCDYHLPFKPTSKEDEERANIIGIITTKAVRAELARRKKEKK